MNRFFIKNDAVSGANLTIIAPDDIRHIHKVLRLKPGDEFVACDQKGTEYYCVVSTVSAASVSAAIKKTDSMILSTNAGAVREPPQLTVACALAKNAKMDDIVDKLTQLGVVRIIPMMTQRVIVQWDKKKAAAHLERWRAIALSASKQSHRRFIPTVDPATNFPAVVQEIKNFDVALIPNLEGVRPPLSHILTRPHSGSVHTRCVTGVILFIGPEGDFTPEEVAAARAEGAIPVTLGRNVLRVDTAAIAAAAKILL